MAKVSLATNEVYKNKKGEKITNTDWHRLTAWGKTAELMMQFCKKGKEVAKLLIKNNIEFNWLSNNDNKIGREVYGKILLTGKDILINGISKDTKDIFTNIVAEENITGVLLCDKQGKIKYATNTKFENAYIKQIFPDFDTNNPSLGWGGNESQMVIATPIYNTFGKVGTVILITRKNNEEE